MRLDALIKMLGIRVDNLRQKELPDKLAYGGIVFILNVDYLVKLRHDFNFMLEAFSDHHNMVPMIEHTIHQTIEGQTFEDQTLLVCLTGQCACPEYAD